MEIAMDSILAVVIVLGVCIVIRAVITFTKNGLVMLMMNIVNKIFAKKK